MISNIDHIVIAAPSLESGEAFVQQALGVALQAGGSHPRMGTHNLLLRLGDKTYLEVISPDPSAPSPDRPRWFGLDNLPAHGAPRLLTWVAWTSDIRAAAAAASEDLGPIEAMNRGAFRWQITIPGDGAPVLGGAVPALIQWETGGHPAAGLEDRGLSLESLTIFHSDPLRVTKLVESIGIEGPLAVSALSGERGPYLEARIHTAKGLRVLSTPDRGSF